MENINAEKQKTKKSTIIPGQASSIPQIIKTLQSDRIAILKCDTIYGIIGTVPTTCGAIKSLKGRDKDKPLLVLIPSEEHLSRFTDTLMPEALKPYWPGPLTLIFPQRGGGSIALRVPDDPFLCRIMEEGNLDLYSTSVNQQGEPHLNHISQIIERYGDRVDLIVDSGDAHDALPSTIVDIRTTPFTLVRQGVLQLPGEIFWT